MNANHGEQIAMLRGRHGLDNQLAADLLELHDRTGISLDDWETARTFVENLTGSSVAPNGA